MDMGECQKIHDVALRADFERSQKDKDHFYDLDVSHFAIALGWNFTESLLGIRSVGAILL
jgi:hypothetical protein